MHCDYSVSLVCNISKSVKHHLWSLSTVTVNHADVTVDRWDRQTDEQTDGRTDTGLLHRPCKLCATVRRCLQHKARQNMTDCCIHISDIARRQHLRSTGCHQLFVPRHRRSVFDIWMHFDDNSSLILLLLLWDKRVCFPSSDRPAGVEHDNRCITINDLLTLTYHDVFISATADLFLLIYLFCSEQEDSQISVHQTSRNSNAKSTN